jgi:exodeoxyribonuclease VII small subunit
MAKSPAKDIPDDIKAMSFEDAMAELEMIVQRLEQGKGTLEDSIHSYERGAHLRHYCEQKLADARERVERITIGHDGIPETKPFDVD